MFDWLKKWHKTRHRRAFLIIEARRHMRDLGMNEPSYSDQAVLNFCLDLGAAQLMAMVLAKKFNDGTNRVVLAAFGDGDLVQQVH